MNRATIVTSLCAGVFVAWGLPLFAQRTAPSAQPRSGETKPTRTRPAATQAADEAAPPDLSARLSARADAAAKLLGRIGKLKLASGTSVRDFWGESETLEVALRVFLSSLPESAEPRYCDKGECTVEMTLPLENAAAALKYICRKYYKADKFKPADFDEITREPGKALSASGIGRTSLKLKRSKLLRSHPDAPVEAAKLEPKTRKLWQEHCTSAGRREAESAARRDAMARLAEKIKLVHIAPDRTVEQFLASSTPDGADVKEFLKGARITGVWYYDELPLVRAQAQINLRVVYASVRTWALTNLKSPKQTDVEQLEKLIIRSRGTEISQVGVGVPEARHLKKLAPAVEAALSIAADRPDWAGAALLSIAAAAGGKTWGEVSLAELDERVRVATQIHALEIRPGLTVGDLAATSKQFNRELWVWLQSEFAISSAPPEAEPTATSVNVDLEPLWEVILRHYARSDDQGR